MRRSCNRRRCSVARRGFRERRRSGMRDCLLSTLSGPSRSFEPDVRVQAKKFHPGPLLWGSHKNALDHNN
jgi:hypothetical protein